MIGFTLFVFSINIKNIEGNIFNIILFKIQLNLFLKPIKTPSKKIDLYFKNYDYNIRNEPN